jgi:hypothetical protein
MRALIVVFAALVSCLTTAVAAAQAPERTAALDKAYEEARAASLALKEAEVRRDLGIEPQEGERQGTATGASRFTTRYLGRQQLLEVEVENARRRYEAALKRWNDLKY